MKVKHFWILSSCVSLREEKAYDKRGDFELTTELKKDRNAKHSIKCLGSGMRGGKYSPFSLPATCILSPGYLDLSLSPFPGAQGLEILS